MTTRRSARRRPPTVKVELPDGGPLLVPIAWERLGVTSLPPSLRLPALLHPGCKSEPCP